VVLLLLLRLSPQLFSKPILLGTYWAYVFPLAALASAG
jgi:tellurite resistance protein TehA-like permease